MNKKKVTFADIAKYTNFSKTTISRYFNNPDSLTVENQDIIAQALIDLDYQENKIAKVLANGKTEFIGIIIPTLFFHYYAEILNLILLSYEKYGYKFLVFLGTGDQDQERRYIQELLAYNIEGLIVLSHAIPSKELAQTNIPTVAIERESKYICSVDSDNYMGGMQAASLLIKNQCDVLIHINSFASRSVPAHQRIEGFRNLCEEQKVPYEIILRKFRESFKESNAILYEIFDYIKHKYSGKKKGLFLANDTYANIMLNILIREYHEFPKDYRLIGFDNSPIAEEAVIPISTVGQQIDKLASEAMELLMEQIEERKKRRYKLHFPIVHKKVTPVLIRRGTTE